MIKKCFIFLSITLLLVGSINAIPTSAATRSNAAMSMQVTMMPQAFSGVTGTATLTYNSTAKTTTVKVTVKHLEPGSTHPAHIHSGKCSVNGPVIAVLNTIKADMNGTGTSTTVVPGSYTTKHAYINVHLGPGLGLTGYTVLACGQLGMSM